MDSSSMKASAQGEASGPVSFPLSTPESFSPKVLEPIYETLPGAVNKDLIFYKASNRDGPL